MCDVVKFFSSEYEDAVHEICNEVPLWYWKLLIFLIDMPKDLTEGDTWIYMQVEVKCEDIWPQENPCSMRTQVKVYRRYIPAKLQ